MSVQSPRHVLADRLETLGKYELVRKLAVGGMAEVFLARSGGAMGFTKTLVVKRILPHLADDPLFVEMFLREAKIAAELTHPNVVQIFDFGESGGRYYIAMEYVDGPSLRTLIRRGGEVRASMPPEIAARLISYACEGLGFAHAFADPETGQVKDIVHRDVSPDNILVSRTGAVKVADFGLAKALKSNAHTQAGMLKGKIPYLAPEQIRGKGADRRSDIYALGVTLYELCTGRRPFEAESDVELMVQVAQEPPPPPRKLRPDLPEELASVIDRALRKSPEQRYQTCREMQGDLDAYLRLLDRTIGHHELADHVRGLDAIPRTSTGRHLPAAAEPLPTRPDRERTTPSPAAGRERTPPTVEPAPAPPTQPQRPPPTVPRGFQERPDRPERSPARVRSGLGTASLIATRLKELIAEVPPERRPFLYGGAGVLGLLLAILALASFEPRGSFGGPCVLEVDSVPPARIRVNGREMGRTPRVLTGLPAGMAVVEVHDPDVPFSKKQLVTLAPGNNPPRRFVISREPVELQIYPPARVKLDGRDLGLTPLDPVILYEGRHRLHLAYEGTGAEDSFEFEVRGGEQNVVKRRLVNVPR